MIPRKPAKLIERKLGKEKADGLVQPLPSEQRRYRNAIHIDPRLEPKAWLETACHELVHVAFPWLSEEATLAFGKYIADSLWSYGFRRLTQ